MEAEQTAAMAAIEPGGLVRCPAVGCAIIGQTTAENSEMATQKRDASAGSNVIDMRTRGSGPAGSGVVLQAKLISAEGVEECPGGKAAVVVGEL